MNTSKYALLAIAATLLIACAKKDAAAPPAGIAGSWKGDAAATTDEGAKMMIDSMSLELKADQTFTMQMGISMEGKWAQTGSTVNLTPTKMGGSTIAELHKLAGADKGDTDNFGKPIVLQLSPDQKSLNIVQYQTGAPKGAIVFRKS